MMDCSCPVMSHAAISHMRRLQIINSKGLDIIVGVPWNVRNLQLHKLLEALYLDEHIRNLTQSFDCNILDFLLVRQLRRYLIIYSYISIISYQEQVQDVFSNNFSSEYSLLRMLMQLKKWIAVVYLILEQKFFIYTRSYVIIK